MSASKQKGTAWETKVVRFFEAYGHRVRRNPPAGRDIGDIGGIDELVIQCKNVRTHQLGAWQEQTIRQRDNADADAGVVVIHRQGHGEVDKAYFMLDAESFMKMLEATGWGG